MRRQSLDPLAVLVEHDHLSLVEDGDVEAALHIAGHAVRPAQARAEGSVDHVGESLSGSDLATGYGVAVDVSADRVIGVDGSIRPDRYAVQMAKTAVDYLQLTGPWVVPIETTVEWKRRRVARRQKVPLH